jgi:hypothetical protein
LFYDISGLGYEREWFRSDTNPDGSPIGWHIDINGWFTAQKKPLYRHKPKVEGKYNDRKNGWIHQAKTKTGWSKDLDYETYANMYRQSVEDMRKKRWAAQKNGASRY